MEISDEDLGVIRRGMEALVRISVTNARERGFHEQPRTFAECVALAHSELSEALEAYRDPKVPREELYEVRYRDDGKPIGIAAELADVFVRLADTAGYRGIDLAGALLAVLRYNLTRPYKHGNKRL